MKPLRPTTHRRDPNRNAWWIVAGLLLVTAVFAFYATARLW